MNISYIIVAYKSDHVLENLISSIPSKNEIIVVENSLNNKIKFSLEKKYTNLRVFIPSENLGYSAGVNLGVNKSSGKYVFILTPDIILTKDIFLNFEKILNKFDNFSLLAPVYKDNSIHNNFKIFNNRATNKFNIDSFNIREVDEIDGACFLINKEKFKNKNIMDENYFLYFDSTDLCQQLRKEKKNMYVVTNLTFTHEGTASSKEEYKFEILVNRNWHYSWSKFYFYKKNIGYFFSLKKIFPNLIKAIFNFIFYGIILNHKKARLNKAIISGILHSMLLRKSSFRPKID